MYYSGTNNDAYRKYAQYRDWLYAIDDKVIETIGVSVFSLVNMCVLAIWYIEGVSHHEAAMWTIVKGVI